MTCVYTHIYMCGFVHISNFESIECGNCPMIISLVHQTRTCSLATIGRFKFMDNTAILMIHVSDMIMVLKLIKNTFEILFIVNTEFVFILKNGACVLDQFILFVVE